MSACRPDPFPAMLRSALLVAAGLLLAFGLSRGAAAGEVQAPQANVDRQEYSAEPGPWAVKSLLDVWTDAARDRAVPVKIYYPTAARAGEPEPAEAAERRPLVVVSHGLGGSREGLAYFGQHLASQGYVCVHVQHKGSDSSVWIGTLQPVDALLEAAGDPQNSIDRFKDVSFAIDQLERLNRGDGPLAGRLELSKIAVAGHSFGSYTALAVAGRVFHPKDRRAVNFRDRRVRAIIAMSSPVHEKSPGRLKAAFGPIKVPCLHMTGTEDRIGVDSTQPEDRRLPFEYMRAADQYLLTFDGGTHLTFSDLGPLLSAGADRRRHELIITSSTAFLDAYLLGNEKAESWLAEGGFAHALGEAGTFEVRRLGE